MNNLQALFCALKKPLQRGLFLVFDDFCHPDAGFAPYNKGMKQLFKKMNLALMSLALLAAGPAIAYRCGMDCSMTDDAALLCMSSQVLNQAMFEAEHGNAASLDQADKSMGVERVDSLFVASSKPEIEKPQPVFQAAAAASSSKILASAGMLHSGLDPPGLSAAFGLPAIPPQNAPPAGILFC